MKRFRKLGLAAAMTLGVLAFLTGGIASATTIEIKGVTQNKSVQASASLQPSTSMILKDSFGTTTDTCTEAFVKGATEGVFSGASVGGKLGTLTVGNCSHTTTVLSPGSMSVVWTSGTNGSVTSAASEVTTVSTAFGSSAVCKTGSGTPIGTVTGVKEGHATLDVNAKVSCGILGTGTLTGTFTGTGSGGLGVVN
ncbi:MAG TPA: hypothetical protein VFN18_02550 [Solirubrobacterales bacterium]|nr:hypothetical protein [Solirubrobacterales bacterium]